MYKRFIAFILIVILIMSLGGCGKSSTTEGISNNDAASSSASSDEQSVSDTSLVSSNVTDNISPNHYTPTSHNYIAKDIYTFESVSYNMPTSAEKSLVYVEPIKNLPEDFIKGVDASEVLAMEDSGIRYYDANGHEQDVFTTLAQSGVNCIRLRVWNNPYDVAGNPYGGGNCDVDTAIALGQRASINGMNVIINFQYSDFWANSQYQLAPTSWKNFSVSDKAAAIYDYTFDSLEQILVAGVNVSMVQIGNENNNGICSVTNEEDVALLLQSGCQAVRKISEVYDIDLLIALNYTNATDYTTIDHICSSLKASGVDYDVMSLSYYSYKSGSFEDFKSVASRIIRSYGKQVLISEFSYPYTALDGDFYPNQVAGGELVGGYTSSIQSQATFIRDTFKLANDSGCMGAIYFGGTWIPASGGNNASNAELWELYGCGYSTSFAAPYLGSSSNTCLGCPFDNQALFSFEGKPLASLDVFKYLSVGTSAIPSIDYVPDIRLQCYVGKDLTLPDTIPAIFNDRSLNSKVLVIWEEDFTNIDTSSTAEYVIPGIVTGLDGEEIPVLCYLSVVRTNLAKNGGFEESNTNMWNISYEGSSNPTNIESSATDAYSGNRALYFGSDEDMDFTISQTVKRLSPGTYMVSVFSQGSNLDDDCEMTLFVNVDGHERTIDFMDTSRNDWQNPDISGFILNGSEITFGVHIKANAGSHGTLDNFSLCKID